MCHCLWCGFVVPQWKHVSVDKVTVADYQLHYTNPGKGFKPENVKGRLGTLVTVKVSEFAHS